MENRETPEISKDLEVQLHNLRLIAQTHQLMSAQAWTLNYVQAVQDCIQFLAALHDRSMRDAVAHPDADNVPALVQAKAAITSAAANKDAEVKPAKKAKKVK